MNCRGCNTPIKSDTYCERCLDELKSLIYAQPFVWPEWAIVTSKVLCGMLAILLIALFFLGISLLTPDTQY